MKMKTRTEEALTPHKNNGKKHVMCREVALFANGKLIAPDEAAVADPMHAAGHFARTIVLYLQLLHEFAHDNVLLWLDQAGRL
jgi:hypothetical protein